MTSRRDTDRDRGDREREKYRESESRRQQPPSSRAHEYFVPRDGIDREVITADICRYLGNDALVRPGTYENPQTRQVQQVYFITAYRNLTTAMIADLRLDSERWEKERRAAAGSRPINGTSSRDSSGFGRPSNTHSAPQYVGSRTQHDREYNGPSSDSVPPLQYIGSRTKHERDYNGPSESMPSPQGYSGAPSSIGTSQGQQGMYDSGYSPHQYQQPPPQPQSYIQPSSGAYGQQQQSQHGGQFPIHQETQRSDYTYGAPFAVEHPVDPRSVDPRRVPVTQGAHVPRGSEMYSSTSGPSSGYPPQDPSRYNSYSSQAPISSNQYSQQQPTDTLYGRAPAPVSSYDTAMDYSSDSHPQQYQDSSTYSSQAPISSTFSQAPSMSSVSSGFTNSPMTSGFSQPPVSAPINPTIATGAPTSRRGEREDRRREDRDRHHRRP